MPAYSLRWADQYTDPYIESAEELEQRKAQLNKAIDVCVEADPSARSKLKAFLLEKGIGGITEMDYPLRASYEEFLTTEVKQSGRYLKAFDQIKRHSIREEMKTLTGRQRCQWRYENVILYLPYHSDGEVADLFSDTRQKEVLVWDFSRNCSEKLKRQIFEILNFMVADIKDRNRRRRRLLGLQEFYDYCACEDISNIENLEQHQIDKFLDRVGEKGSSNGLYGGGLSLINQCRKIIFLNHEEINWQANVWYLERLHLTPGRINPTAGMDSISFLEVTHLQNREYLKQYMKYEMGVTGQAFGTIYTRFRRITAFLLSLENKNLDVTECTAKDIDRHINCLLEQHGDAKHFNEKVMGILHFFMFLGVRGYIQKIPFKAEYYLQKVIPTHNEPNMKEKRVVQKKGW